MQKLLDAKSENERDVEYEIETIGGNCPVQAEGVVCGDQFYFRARGGVLQMHVHPDDPLASDAWFFEQRYKEFPAAGWISHESARAWIAFALTEWALQTGAYSQ